jgi:hypothetical protein
MKLPATAGHGGMPVAGGQPARRKNGRIGRRESPRLVLASLAESKAGTLTAGAPFLPAPRLRRPPPTGDV